MGNSVTIKVDSRVFYGLVAILAVVGIFAIGIWLGGEFTGGDTDTAANPAQVSDVAPADPGSNPATIATPNVQLNPQNPGDSNVQVSQSGSNPISPDEVAVEDGQPRIWIPEVADSNFQYDFGSIAPDGKAEKDFVVENVGSGVLEITDASASCGCTAALVEDSTLEAGESTTIRVQYDPRVNQEFGRFVTKQIRIKSNDPLVPLAEFTVTADVQAQ